MARGPYQELFCTAHGLWYGIHLSNCPVCVGEAMGHNMVFRTTKMASGVLKGIAKREQVNHVEPIKTKLKDKMIFT